MEKEIIGECSLCGSGLTQTYYGINKIDEKFDWHCFCFVAKTKPIFYKEYASHQHPQK